MKLTLWQTNNRGNLIAPVGPHIGPFGLALAGVELLHGCLIGMQYLALQEQFGRRSTTGCRLTPS